VRETAVPPPGEDHQLGELVARLVGRPLDRSRPLWETYVIQGLAGGRFAILTKIHHATVDGASGAELLTMMLDTTVDGDEVDGPDDGVAESEDSDGPDESDGRVAHDGEWTSRGATLSWRTERVPGDGEMVMKAAGSLIRKPGRAVLLSARTARELGQATRNPVLVAAANQLSGQRPGARREQLESYVKRLYDLEKLAQGFPGVEKVFAIQAGREMRVLVDNATLSDEQAVMLSRDLARKIENEMTYPGQVRVCVIRQTRATDYAK
jgi:hypothetical protein